MDKGSISRDDENKSNQPSNQSNQSIISNFSFSNINMSIREGYKRNNKKEKGNQYCDHNMAGDYNTGTVLLS